jgi:hypothetical protein
VRFYRHTARPVQPYYLSPWQTENLRDLPAPVLVPLRGDFFCAPFVGNGEAYRGEQHPPHGEPAGSPWSWVAAERSGRVASLTLALQPRIRPGTITRRFSLVDGQNVVYTQETLAGFSGRMPLGHHATLAVPEQEGAMRVATSPFRFGMTNPGVFSHPANREYQSFAIHRKFRDLRRVPLLWQDPAEADATAFPARTGFTDLLALFARPTGTPAWTTATVQSAGYLWFSLRDPAVLPTTLFWISNRGRHGVPWNGRNRCLGLEDVCAYFADGLAASARPNLLNRQGIPTAITLSPRRPTVINYIQGVVKVPANFQMVKSVAFGPGAVRFVSVTGQKVVAAVNHAFLKTGELLPGGRRRTTLGPQ